MSRITASQALELQHEQFAFAQSHKGLRYWTSFSKMDSEDEARPFQAVEVVTLKLAPTYLVAEEMYQLALHAARSMPDVPLAEGDLPSPSGFCLLEQPIVAPDVHGKLVSMAGFTWHIAIQGGKKGVFWTIYSDTRDPRDDYYDAELIEGMPRLLPVGRNMELFGDLSLTLEEVQARQGGSEETIAEAILHMRTLPLCIFTLMQQTIVVQTPEKPRRHVRRRLKRKDSPLHEKMVKIVRLRRVRHRETPKGESQPVDWSHRWVVSGHWRLQPTNQGVKRIYIMPFVKGPEDKPLLIKETVHVLDR